MTEHAPSHTDDPPAPPVRSARRDDLATIVGLVRELAEYERSADQVCLDVPALEAALFGPEAVATCHVVEHGGEVVGFALFFRTFSTWTGRSGLWLEDLYVRPAARGKGLGRALLASLAQYAVEAGLPRVEWAVLDWNTPAWGFYAALGARSMDDWTTHRLTGEALTALGTRSTAGPRPQGSEPAVPADQAFFAPSRLRSP